MTIEEAACGITGGVDTHRDVHVAAALDPLGGLLGSESFCDRPCWYKAPALLARDLWGGDQDRRGDGSVRFGTLADLRRAESDGHRMLPES